MRHIRIYTNMLILFLTAIFLLTGCGKMHDVTKEEAALNYWDGEDATYIDVSLDYSAYGKWHTDWIDWYMPTFYLDEEQQTEVVGEGTDQTYHLKVPSDIKYLYVKPPTIAVISELEDQSIALNQEFPIKTEYFDIVAANIPQLVNQNHDQDSIKIAVYLISETNQYPKSISLRYNGKSYRFSGTEKMMDDYGNPEYICYTCEMPDLYTAAMALKYGSLYYFKLLNIVSADKVIYKCTNSTIRLEVIGD
jgi:hypothetical protein